MHRAPFVAVASSLVLVASTAAAQVTEPNGLQVPIASAGEEQLYTLFSDRGENINWITDAHTTPNQFSPLCGFTATYVLNQAASHFGLAWYNDTGTQPTAADLHQLVPANSAVGTMFTGTEIKNDPNYTGGVVGFALIGGETHYTNPAYDNICSGCNPPGPWITALIYASTVTPDAYYVCYEDGPTSADSWDNDGDFNDDVYFITGVTCSGGGQPCNTGKPGICAAGITTCSSTGVTCQEISPPAATETCNGVDDNCNGMVDEGAICPEEQICSMGMCVPDCTSGEFPCQGGLVCSAQGTCVEPSCLMVTCPQGQICYGGVCKGPCDGVVCPNPQVCRVGVCLDPCGGVTCNAGQVCDQGVCIEGCNCQPCGQGEACNTMSGQCVQPSCASVTCAAGTYCVSGNCVDDCAGATCPGGGACVAGNCQPPPVEVPDSGGPIEAPDSGGITSTSSDGGGSGTGADASTGAGLAPLGAPSRAGCGCRAVGDETGVVPLLAVLGAGLAVGVARRRRRGVARR
jgi:hypothetical protein